MGQKDIGILTFHSADNLGAVLQGYALQNALQEKYTVKVQIINYLPPALQRTRQQKGIKKIAMQIYYRIKHNGFEKFRKKHLPLSLPYTPTSIHSLQEKYDAVIVGSDQVWNYECSDWDDTYFLNFLDEKTKRYSYAASLGRYRFSDSEKEKVRSLLQHFDGISVREESGKKHLEEITGQEICLMPDPVMLLDAEQWKQVMSPRLIKKRYVFVYLIQPNLCALQAAKKYAEKHGCRVICNKFSPEFVLRGAPEDFLSWIYYADRVFTNSFHGTAFSIVFEKVLGAETAMADGSPNYRVFDILNLTGNERCIIDQNNTHGAQASAGPEVEDLKKAGYEYLAEICQQ